MVVFLFSAAGWTTGLTSNLESWPDTYRKRQNIPKRYASAVFKKKGRY